MHPTNTWGLLACASQLLLALLAFARLGKSPLAVPLGLLCLDVAGWSGSAIVYRATHVLAWDLLDHALTPFTAPLALNFALAFVGRRRALRWLLWPAFIGSAALATPSVHHLITQAPGTGRGVYFDLWLLLCTVPAMGASLWLLWQHARLHTDALERARARLVLTSIGCGTALGVVDVAATFFPRLPASAEIGMLLATLPMSMATLRFRLLDRERPLATLARSIVGIAVLCVSLALLSVLRGAARAQAASALLMIFVVALFFASEWRARLEQRERKERLVVMGRFAAQLTHDLKNPLAALRGAAQLLRFDMESSHPSIDRLATLDLMIAQVDRVTERIDAYVRLADSQPQLEPVDVNAAVESLTMHLRLGAPARCAITTALDPTLPLVPLDRDMLATIVDNLVRNAIDACADGGRIVVRTARSNGTLLLQVEDDGSGMDAPTAERAFDDFFTTKAAGSGLGLAFVRRLTIALGGRASLQSLPGKGTTVSIHIPLREGAFAVDGAEAEAMGSGAHAVAARKASR
jgi:two-component system sensor histidine kinase HydH